MKTLLERLQAAQEITSIEAHSVTVLVNGTEVHRETTEAKKGEDIKFLAGYKDVDFLAEAAAVGAWLEVLSGPKEKSEGINDITVILESEEENTDRTVVKAGVPAWEEYFTLAAKLLREDYTISDMSVWMNGYETAKDTVSARKLAAVIFTVFGIEDVKAKALKV